MLGEELQAMPVFWRTSITTCGSKPFLKDNNVENIYGRLNLILVRANARAFNARLATTMDLLEG